MNFDFNPTTWFICKLCKNSFQHTEELKAHKLANHWGDCMKIKCIVFEEKLLNYEWTPKDQNGQVVNQRPNDEAEDADKGEGSFHAIVLSQNKAMRNPYVSIPRVPLTTEQLGCHLVVNRNSDTKTVRSYGRKQTRGTQPTAHNSKSAGIRPEVDIKVEVDETAESQFSSITIASSIFEASSADANEAVSSPPPPRVKQSIAQTKHANFTTAAKFNSYSKLPSSSSRPLNPAGPKPVLKTYSRKPSLNAGAGTVRILGDANIFSDQMETPENPTAAPILTPRKRNRSKNVIAVSPSDHDEEDDKRKLNNNSKRRRIRCTRVPTPVVKNIKKAVKKRPTKSRSAGTKNKRKKTHSKSPVCRVPLSFPQWLQLLKDRRLNETNQMQDKNEQNSGQSIFPENTILLDPDPTSADFDPKLMSQENGVTCVLCSTKLVTQSELQLHADNCWFHNKVFHRYCVPCQISFENPIHLRQHRLHAHVDPIPENDPANIDLPVDLDHGESDSDSVSDSNASSSLSLGQWIRKLEAKKNGNLPFPKIIILLHPDPTAENYVNSHESHFDPIKCKLCETTLSSETEVKKHVVRCWTHHKNRHRFCVLCQRSWKTPWSLRVHNKLNHEEGPKFPFKCHLCHTGFLNELDWKRHAMSLAEFRPILNSKLRNYKKGKQNLEKIISEETPDWKTKKKKKIKSTSKSCLLESQSAESEGETLSTCLRDWIKEQRKKDPSNIIRVQPDPTETADEVEPFEMSSVNPVSCNLCQTAFTSEPLLRRHLLNCWLHNKRSHRYCIPCERVYYSAYLLVVHNSKMHCSTPRPTFNCKHCPSTFVDPRGLIKHEGTVHRDWGSNPELMSGDKLKAILQPRLQLKLENRLKLKPFKCELCPRAYAYNFLLQFHRKTHSERQLLKCPQADCSREFQFENSLERHLDSAHTHPSEKIQCPEPGCSMVFKFRKSLLLHGANVHGTEAEFVCSICSKIFVCKERLEVHERVHRLGRPFKCSVDGCGGSFMTNTVLSNHVRSKHSKALGLPEHLCPVCGKTFGVRGNLEKHIRVAHNKAKS